MNDNEQTRDAILVTRAKQGDATAFQALAERYTASALCAACAVLGNRQAALDVVQEALLKVAREFASTWRGGSFRVWLTVCTRRLALNYLREETTRRRIEDQAMSHRFKSEVLQPTQVCERKEEVALLREELVKLPVRIAEPLTAFYLHHCSVAEIAKSSGISVAACKQRIHRARETLAVRLRKRGVSMSSLSLLSVLDRTSGQYAAENVPQILNHLKGSLNAWSTLSETKHLRGSKEPFHPMLRKAPEAGRVLAGMVCVIAFALAFFLAEPLLFLNASSPLNGMGSGKWLARGRSKAALSNSKKEKHEMNKKVLSTLLSAAMTTSLASSPAVGYETNPEGNADKSTVETRLSDDELFEKHGVFRTDEFRIKLSDTVKGLRELPKEALEKIPGESIEDKARYVLESPSITKTIKTKHSSFEKELEEEQVANSREFKKKLFYIPRKGKHSELTPANRDRLLKMILASGSKIDTAQTFVIGPGGRALSLGPAPKPSEKLLASLNEKLENVLTPAKLEALGIKAKDPKKPLQPMIKRNGEDGLKISIDAAEPLSPKQGLAMAKALREHQESMVAKSKVKGDVMSIGSEAKNWSDLSSQQKIYIRKQLLKQIEGGAAVEAATGENEPPTALQLARKHSKKIEAFFRVAIEPRSAQATKELNEAIKNIPDETLEFEAPHRIEGEEYVFKKQEGKNPEGGGEETETKAQEPQVPPTDEEF